MKKVLLSLTLLLPVVAADAQQLLDPGFEKWSIYPYEDPDNWMTTNPFVIPGIVPTANVLKVSPAVSNFGIKMKTVTDGSDIIPGIIWTGSSDPLAALDGEGGIPFSDKPTTLSGSFRYSVGTGDTGYIYILFKNSGTVFATDTVRFTGTIPNFVVNNYALPHITASSTTPDSVIIVASSSDFFASTTDGHTLEMDNLALTGPGVTQSINGSFDNWTSTNITVTDDWQKTGTVEQSTDKLAGTYAAKLITSEFGGFPDYASLNQDFTLDVTLDTLVGFYKYTTTGNDSTLVSIRVMNIGGPATFIHTHLGPAATYTMFKIPLVSGANTTGANIEFMSSSYMVGNETIGSALYLDSLGIKKQDVGVGDVAGAKAGVKVYPNPAKDVLNVAVNNSAIANAAIAIYNAIGTKVYAGELKLTNGKVQVPVKQLAAGLYIYEIAAGGTEYKGRFLKD